MKVVGQLNLAFPKWDRSTPDFRHWVPCKEQDMFRDVAIYVLGDPLDRTVRYVGASTCPTLRYQQHLRRSSKAIEAWKAELAQYGVRPRMAIVDWVYRENRDRAERLWISYYAARGRIYNLSSGGRGEGLHLPTSEKRAAMTRQKREKLIREFSARHRINRR